MKKILVLLLVAVALAPAAGLASEWLTDLPAAQQKARAENKIILLDFTGSDWCGWCMRLKREVFDQPEFAAYASANLVPVELDFPHHKAQSPDLKRANEELAQRFHIEGFPTIILLNANGQKVGQLGYMAGGPKVFTAELDKIPGMKHGNVAAATAVDPEPEPPRKPPSYAPIAPTVPVHYEGLALKAISGGKDRRIAMINNETFSVGETAKVKVKDERVEVCCKEIRENSVLITANGQTMELKLTHH